MYQILIAEDEPLERKVLCNILRKHFGELCEIHEAKTGTEAVALFLEDKIGFYDIYDLVKGAMDAIPFIADPTLEQVLQCDAAARKYVAEHA